MRQGDGSSQEHFSILPVGLPSEACGFGDDCAAPSASLSSLSDESPVFPPPPGVCAGRKGSGESTPRGAGSAWHGMAASEMP
jgi:hypothetical protein